MAPLPQYGSIHSESEDAEAAVELLPHGASNPYHSNESNHDGAALYSNKSKEGTIGSSNSTKEQNRWTRHHCMSYSIAALICLFSARYWHGKAESNNTGVDGNNEIVNGGGGANASTVYNRVPVPPVLSNLDPSADLGFRVTSRVGLASPSKAWGSYFLGSNADVDASSESDANAESRRILKEKKVTSSSPFIPLPTNQWFLNLLSHKAAADPSKAGEVGHVYTIPYVLGVSPPNPDPTPDSKHKSTKQTMAGIELFLPVMKTSSTNMQMVFDKFNGVSLGAMVPDDTKLKGDDVLTSYEVDPDEQINPLGVSLRWKYVDMKTHVVRGMPYGTVRFGQKGKSPVLPTIVSGNMPTSILIDSDSNDLTAKIDADSDSTTTTKNNMICGSFTGEPIEQDPNHHAPISSDGKAHSYEVKRELVFHLDQSDFTWVVFFSKPVSVKCYSHAVPVVSVPGGNPEIQFRLDVTEISDSGGKDDDELVVRMALLNECTTGKSIIKEHCDHLDSLGYDTVSSKEKSDEYLKVLRAGAHLYPKSPLVGTEFPEDGESEMEVFEERVTNVVFDWDPTCVKEGSADSGKHDMPTTSVATASTLRAGSSEKVAGVMSQTSESKQSEANDMDGLLMFALPHHLESLASSDSSNNKDTTDYSSLCLHTFHGRTCLVQGSKWTLPVAHGKPQSFLADRPPKDTVIPDLAEALNSDIKFKLSSNVLRGAADTYFPAKVLAKVGRIIEITEELRALKSEDLPVYSDADESTIEAAASAASRVEIPSKKDVESLLDDLQQSVEIWLEPGGKENGGAEAEFLYDASWGGFVNCGCNYTFDEEKPGDGTCANSFPEKCPALEDVNEDFGNGWYNDHHFHYGYHIYAAAVVAKHRPDWGRKYFNRVLLYIRDIANPSPNDKYFPQYRQKDFFLGNSWASGLMSMELSPHGREQESSSEAIAAYEGIALFGDAMMNAFENDEENLSSARLVRNLGEFLTSMEVDAANRFWHVWGSVDEGDLIVSSSGKNGSSSPHINNYPTGYSKPVVGMMHETMASFQTWFAPQEVVSYGIQLMPFTSVAERRDNPEWTKIVYPVYEESCEAANEGSDDFCVDNGWSIIQAGLLAETGDIEKALDLASAVPDDVYTSDGACGNSLSNTIWFISTRKPDAITSNNVST